MREDPGPARGRAPRLADVCLEGELVRLRRPLAEDAEVAFELIHGRREILAWLVWSGPRDADELRERYAAWTVCGEEGDNYMLTVADKADDRFAGTLALHFAGHPAEGQLGYWIASARWGRGWMSEAIGLSAHLCFEHLGARRLYASVFEGNHASRRVLEKNGFADVSGAGTVQPVPGDRPQWAFELTRGRWLADRERVRPRSVVVALEP
jgi:ribosomal-protein-alanine N-acetyltransferase